MEIEAVEDVDEGVVVGDAFECLAHGVGLVAVVDDVAVSRLDVQAAAQLGEEQQGGRYAPVELPLLEVVAGAQFGRSRRVARQGQVGLEARLEAETLGAAPLEHGRREQGRELEAGASGGAEAVAVEEDILRARRQDAA